MKGPSPTPPKTRNLCLGWTNSPLPPSRVGQITPPIALISGGFCAGRGETLIERLAALGNLAQQPVRTESGPVRPGKALAEADKRVCANAVDVRQRPAGKGRKAEPQDRADVGLANVGEDALFEAA